MTTLVPRGPYSKEELEKLYPKGLRLQLVQIVRPPIHDGGMLSAQHWHLLWMRDAKSQTNYKMCLSYFDMVITSLLTYLRSTSQDTPLKLSYRREKPCVCAISECKQHVGFILKVHC